MKSLKYVFMFMAATAVMFTSCNDDDPADPDPLTVVSIDAEGTSFEDGSVVTKDLNAASAATDVALNSTIEVTFDRDIDANSVSSSSVSLSSDAGGVDLTVNISSATLAIDPDQDLERGTMYTLTLSGIEALEGGTLASTSRTFTTEGRAPVVVPNEESMIAYWNFNGTTADEAGEFSATNEIALSYGEDRFGQGNSTALFDGDETLVEVPNGDALMESDDITISFWVKTNTDGHINENGDPANFFVFGLGAFFGFQFEIPANFGSCKLAMSYELENGDKESEDLWFNGSGMDNMNGGWQGWDFVADLTGVGGVEALLKDKWAHVICTYNAAEKQGRMYINGELMKSQDFDLWPDGAPKRTVTGVSYRGMETDVEPILAFGFIKSADSPMWADTPWGDYYKPTANHFKGDLDDVRIFNAPFSADDAQALYDAEKP